jgi:WD40 repeat protein
MRISAYIFFVIMILCSCVPMPDEPLEDTPEISEHGAFILCEGLYGQSNASLSYYNSSNGKVYNNFLKIMNPGFQLGDTANDILVKGDTAFIVVSTNKKIVVFNIRTGKICGEINFEGKRYPRKMAVVNDTVIAVTDLYDHSFSLINCKNHQIIKEHIYTGPAPEGIAVHNNYIFVANSGFGDYLADEPKAGTISVFDCNTLKEIKSIPGVPNVNQLDITKDNDYLYARYNHLPKYSDSVGGIVEIDMSTLNIKRRWVGSSIEMSIDEQQKVLYYVCEKGVKKIELSDSSALPVLVINNMTQNIWLSLKEFTDDKLWIANAKDFQSTGEILIFDKNSWNFLQKFSVGLNPATIVFF